MAKLDEFLQEQADNAPEAGYINVNYGKLVITPNVITWTGDKNNRTKETNPMKAGVPLTKEQTLELVFEVDIAEFNPALEFTWERNVAVKKSGTILTDWSEIVEPSLIHVFGKNWAKEAMKQPYVEVEDAPNISGKASKKTGKVFSVPKFLRAFANKDECAKAREEKYGKGGSATETLAEAPDSVVEQIAKLMESLNNDDTVMGMLNSHSFGQYDPKALYDRAKAFK